MKAVFTFGRMNPVTAGHEKLVNKVRTVARLENGEPLVFLSHSQDKKKNPLQYKEKIRFAKKAFGKIVQMSRSNTIIKVMQELEKKYDEVVLVVGSDRVESMRSLVTKYNGKDYNFKTIEVVSAGERDPDADDVSGMSASKMREFVKDGDLQGFTSGLPDLLKRDAQSVFDAVKSGMGISEEVELDEASLKTIAMAGALIAGLIGTGDGAFASDKETKSFNKTYNSLTIKQRDRVDDMIQKILNR